MKVLLINNSTRRIEQLKNMLKDHELDTVGIWKLSQADLKDHNLIILSGGNYATAFTKRATYDKELDLINNSTVPIFGICLGMQLIIHAYSPSPFRKIEPRRRGVMEINYENKKMKVFESHRWTIDKVSPPLVELGRSSDGVEIIRHKDKPIWGVQFHPEADIEFGTQGKLIFEEFISKIADK